MKAADVSSLNLESIIIYMRAVEKNTGEHTRRIRIVEKTRLKKSATLLWHDTSYAAYG